jgi:hypothetical protein
MSWGHGNCTTEAAVRRGGEKERQRRGYVAFAKAYKKKYKWDVGQMGQPVYRFRPALGFGLFEKKFDQTATRWNFE